MLSPNNPELDTDLLTQKLKTVAEHRYRAQPLFIKPKAVEFTPGVGYTYQTTGVRALIKRIPVLGPFAVAVNRKLRHIKSPGLTWKQRIMLAPVLGPGIHMVYALLRINKIRHEMAQQMIELRQMQQTSHAQTNQRIDQILALDIENRLRRFDALDIGTRLNRLETLDIERRVVSLEETVRNMLANDANRENNLAGLRQELRRHMQAVALSAAPQAAPAAPAHAVTASAFDADAFYTEFERAFRGSREDILDRLKVYLPYLEPLRGDAAARIVDVGCGRGEWLELLGSEGFKALGVDMNAAMVSACRERGLAAECDDAIAYLRRQPEGSVAAVTGFHIIEHLPFETLVALFDAALHALRKDGLIIFETPNPENLMVGACNFYTDPTHLHPVVPAVAEFMVRQRGFARAELLRLHPYPANLQLIEDSDVARRVNQALYGPQDYAVIAWKTYAN
ncbi:class I SAM-dependent methyltransferase [Noviherbaspirillum sp.]|uniref:class I SAM-dependent methyltransferase n=1 Tax=Noviherbaspirillum sp. TaxID=1926288 RepID=UPI002D58E73D|nr:class I SAM-dependent methyltransferase [Noviherbaspirillum sp.]HZW23317.1 class I SAM-dependent methyltransferase [Noviherbaspirillum sp.]